MFRSLIEEENKDVHIFHYSTEKMNQSSLQRMYKNKLRIDSTQHLHVHLIDHQRYTKGDVWFKNL